MKRIIIIASALMAFASFGGQQNRLACAVTNSMQQSDAIVRYSLEVHRAIANRIMRERRDRAERLRREIERAERAERIRRERERNARIIVEENKKSCPVAIMPNGIICRNIHPSQCGLGIGETAGDTENTTLKMKQNSRLKSNDPRWGNRNLNQRKFKLSEPARRRK